MSRRKSFMHNGVFTSLRDVLEFYAARSTTPERWYRKMPFDDLPAKDHANTNLELPPYNQPAGAAPRLDSSDIDALLSFLETLSDRDVPQAP